MGQVDTSTAELEPGDQWDWLVDYDWWVAETQRRIGPLWFDRIERLRDDTKAYANEVTAQWHRNRNATTRALRDEAWELYRSRLRDLDPLGEPIDPSFAGRAKFELAFERAIGLPYVFPGDDDTPPEHRAGEHAGTTLRRAFHGDLPICGACQDDAIWAWGWALRIEWLATHRLKGYR